MISFMDLNLNFNFKNKIYSVLCYVLDTTEKDKDFGKKTGFYSYKTENSKMFKFNSN